MANEEVLKMADLKRELLRVIDSEKAAPGLWTCNDRKGRGKKTMMSSMNGKRTRGRKRLNIWTVRYNE